MNFVQRTVRRVLPVDTCNQFRSPPPRNTRCFRPYPSEIRRNTSRRAGCDSFPVRASTRMPANFIVATAQRQSPVVPPLGKVRSHHYGEP